MLFITKGLGQPGHPSPQTEGGVLLTTSRQRVFFIITVSWVSNLKRRSDILSALFTHSLAVLMDVSHCFEFVTSLILKTCLHILNLKFFELDRVLHYVTVFSLAFKTPYGLLHLLLFQEHSSLMDIQNGVWLQCGWSLATRDCGHNS